MKYREIRTITCTNVLGYSITFGETSISPFLLADCDGIYNYEYNVTTQENGNVDGSTVIGSQLKARNIVITVIDIDQFARNRELLDNVFSCDGVLVYDDGIHKRKIAYTVEKLTGTDGTFQKRTTQISLLCADPHFHDIEDNELDMAYIDSLFEFVHEFKDEEISRIVKTQTLEILNKNGADTSMIIEMVANGAVTNPSIALEETGEALTVGVNGIKDFTLEAEQKIEITTDVNNCTVYLIDNIGHKSNINHYLTSDSVFLRLKHGVNHMAYNAKSGVDNLTVSITFKNNYLRG